MCTTYGLACAPAAPKIVSAASAPARARMNLRPAVARRQLHACPVNAPPAVRDAERAEQPRTTSPAIGPASLCESGFDRSQREARLPDGSPPATAGRSSACDERTLIAIPQLR